VSNLLFKRTDGSGAYFPVVSYDFPTLIITDQMVFELVWVRAKGPPQAERLELLKADNALEFIETKIEEVASAEFVVGVGSKEPNNVAAFNLAAVGRSSAIETRMNAFGFLWVS
jgi:hypothetical protein